MKQRNLFAYRPPAGRKPGRPRKKGRQIAKGVRMAATHPRMGRDTHLCRTWSALARRIGTWRERCRREAVAVNQVHFEISDNGGRTWRQPTNDECLSFLQDRGQLTHLRKGALQ